MKKHFLRLQNGAIAIVASWFMTPAAAMAEDWQPLSGADQLHQLVAGATAEIQLTEDVVGIGTYKPDGTGVIDAWNTRFERTWEVRGQDQVCYSSETETKCFTYERDLNDPARFRSTDVATGAEYLFRLIDADTRTFETSTPVDEEGRMASPSAADIAAELSNPNTTLGTMNTFFDYVAFDGDIPGADSASALRATFQPSLPYRMSETSNLFVRPAIPIIFNQDVPDPNGGFQSEGVDLGDISFDASYGKSLKNGVVVIGGLVGTLPTATNDSLGRDQWLLGPEAAIALVRPWGAIGVLVTHQWDVAGEDSFDTSITGGQYFYSYNLSAGRQIAAGPAFSYNHKAESGNKWTLPLAIGVSQTMILGGRPWKFGLQYWHYVKSPDNFGPEYQLRFQVSPVVKLPW
jgi:hypothetical protein